MAHKLGIAALLTVLVAIVPFINPLVARADTFQYTVTQSPSVIGGPVAFSFTEPTLASSGQVSSGFFSITLPAGPSLLGFAWNSAAGGSCTVPGGFEPGTFPGAGCAGYGLDFGGVVSTVLINGFTAGSFLAPGTYNKFLGLGDNFTVAITDLSVPEPSSLVLLGTGVLTLFGIARKKRLSLSSIPE